MAGVCLPNNEPNGIPCNDNDTCTSLDTCQGGVCTGTVGGCKVTGGGQLTTGLPKVRFGFNAQAAAQTGTFKGQLEYNNYTDGTAYHSVSIILLGITLSPAGVCPTGVSGQRATFDGTIVKKGSLLQCTVALPCNFTVIADDCGEPGRNDRFEIVITDGENRSGQLDKGNIQVH